MKREAEISIKIPFHDLDPVGITWHGHYVKYFEVARCELLSTFDYNYDRMSASGYAWPVIDMGLRYVKSSEFGQEIKVRATLIEWEYRLKIEYLVTDAVSGDRLTKGYTVQVAVDMATNEMCLRSPKVLFDRLGMTP